ncbi:MAG: hypothetical protein R6U28_06690 [Cyclonatronaceae bacterium]
MPDRKKTMPFSMDCVKITILAILVSMRAYYYPAVPLGWMVFLPEKNLNLKVMAMMRYLPILLVLLLLSVAACKMERPARDQLLRKLLD